ncbi:MAG: hypothetical protein GY753_15865 [Gammaproteobacteria bacterium]|nr:hypothetical protein [Gammaproteobacteria bacterium]
MRHVKFHIFTMLTVCFLLTFSVQAANADNIGAIVDKAGKQRMLSQKIAKAYIFLGMGIREEKARRQLMRSITEFNRSHNELKKLVTDKEAQNMLNFLEFGKEEYTSLVKAPFGKENAALVVDFSETMLEGSQHIVERLKATSGIKTARVVDISGRQRMLTQRIAKYYIAYQAGFHDSNTLTQLETAVKLFQITHKRLLTEKINTPEIVKELQRVGKLWKVVEGFYLNVKEGGLPRIVFVTADSIMDSMDKVTRMYAKEVSTGKSG